MVSEIWTRESIVSSLFWVERSKLGSGLRLGLRDLAYLEPYGELFILLLQFGDGLAWTHHHERAIPNTGTVPYIQPVYGKIRDEGIGTHAASLT